MAINPHRAWVLKGTAADLDNRHCTWVKHQLAAIRSANPQYPLPPLATPAPRRHRLLPGGQRTGRLAQSPPDGCMPKPRPPSARSWTPKRAGSKDRPGIRGESGSAPSSICPARRRIPPYPARRGHSGPPVAPRSRPSTPPCRLHPRRPRHPDGARRPPTSSGARARRWARQAELARSEQRYEERSPIKAAPCIGKSVPRAAFPMSAPPSKPSWGIARNRLVGSAVFDLYPPANRTPSSRTSLNRFPVARSSGNSNIRARAQRRSPLAGLHRHTPAESGRHPARAYRGFSVDVTERRQAAKSFAPAKSRKKPSSTTSP